MDNTNTFIDYNKQYSELQYEYIQNPNDRNITKLYLLLVKYAKARIGVYCRKHHCRINDVDTKSIDVAEEVIIQYLKHKDFYIKKISTYIYFPLQKILFQNAKEEINTRSFNELDFDEGENG